MGTGEISTGAGRRSRGRLPLSTALTLTVLALVGLPGAAAAQGASGGTATEIAPVDVTARAPRRVVRPRRGPVLRAVPAGRPRIARAPARRPAPSPVVAPVAALPTGPAPVLGIGGAGPTTGERADGPVRGFVATRSATGTKTDTPLVRIPQSITVIGQDQIAATGARTPSEAVRYSAGVQAERFGADPASLVVAWQGDLKRHSPELYERLRAKSPAAERIATVGEASADTFSVEAALAVAPDVAVFGGTYGPSPRSTEVIRRLEAAGVPVVFVDFFTDPLRNTVPSLRVLGRLLGREGEAEAYVAFHEARLARIAERLTADRPRPTVYLQAFGGAWDCCWIPGDGLGQLIALAGGANPGAAKFPGRAWGRVDLEFVLASEPALYVTTGNPTAARGGGLSLGPGVDAATARAALAAASVAEVAPVRAGRAHGLWHMFHGLPMNVVAVEALAKWINPGLFPDLDPAATMAEIDRRFSSLPLSGAYVIDAR